MKIETFGDKNNPVFLAIHPMFTGGFFLGKLIEICKDKYYFIIPTMSGHYANSEYVSMAEEEKAIIGFLKSTPQMRTAVSTVYSVCSFTAIYPPG